MKPIHKIAAYLSIALLAFANLGTHVSSGGQVAYPKAHCEQSQLDSATGGLPIYGLTEEWHCTGTGQGNGAPSFKHPVGWAVARTAFLNAQQISGVGYFLLTKFLLIGFSSTDAIYPFHQFW